MSYDEARERTVLFEFIADHGDIVGMVIVAAGLAWSLLMVVGYVLAAAGGTRAFPKGNRWYYAVALVWVLIGLVIGILLWDMVVLWARR